MRLPTNLAHRAVKQLGLLLLYYILCLYIYLSGLIGATIQCLRINLVVLVCFIGYKGSVLSSGRMPCVVINVEGGGDHASIEVSLNISEIQ